MERVDRYTRFRSFCYLVSRVGIRGGRRWGLRINSAIATC